MNLPAAAIALEGVDVLFGPRRRRPDALARLDAGEGRDTVREATGVVAGVVGASLEVAPGEIVVLMGLSGSGKSSLLRTVNGLNEAARGSIRVAGGRGRAGEGEGGAVVEVRGLRGRALRDLRRRSLAMVFQQFGLLPWATVAENVGFGLAVRGEPKGEVRRRVAEQLELVGLAGWADAPIASLSGGMQQRVGLARAFATEAGILLMDEPYSALDPLIRERLQDELLELQARLGRTILFVSHDLDEAIRIGDRICLMHDGRIVQTGTAEDIVFRPATAHVARFVRGVNPLDVLTAGTLLRAGGGDGDDPKAGGGSSRVAPADVPRADIEAGPVAAPAVPVARPGTPIGPLLAQAAASDVPIEVREGDRTVGAIGRADLLAALARGASRAPDGDRTDGAVGGG